MPQTQRHTTETCVNSHATTTTAASAARRDQAVQEVYERFETACDALVAPSTARWTATCGARRLLVMRAVTQHPPSPPQPGTLGGVHNEFIFSGRLDNLAMSYVALQVRKGTWFALKKNVCSC
jgi:hypothetical protein